MNKLFKLKEWLTLEETARRLTTSFQESVSIADCLQLALDGHITISVLIEKTKLGMFCKEEELSKDIIRGFVDFMKGNGDVSDELIKLAEDGVDLYPAVTKLRNYGEVFKVGNGVYDLPMIGAERLDVQHLCSVMQGREPVAMIDLDGPYLKAGDSLINILEPFNKDNIEWRVYKSIRSKLFDRKHERFIDENNYNAALYPADGLRNVEFVFRRENIEAFENSQIDDKDNASVTLNGCLEVIGSMLDTIKNTHLKGKRWTQDALKSEMTNKRNSLKPRSIDEYFSLANKVYKSKT